jgi:hypothetical protein
MRRTPFSITLGVLILFAFFGTPWAASEQAMKLRTQSDLSEYTPPAGFLNGNFVADEVEPTLIFGKVSDFAKTRSCPATWLIDSGERNRLQKQGQQSGPFEYTLYLEEDCPEKVVHYIFIDRSQADSTQWMEWRKLFHKNKAEQQYSTVKADLEKAVQNGVSVQGELRFVEVDGNLIVKKPEDYLTGDLKIRPIYDLKQEKAPAQ